MKERERPEDERSKVETCCLAVLIKLLSIVDIISGDGNKKSFLLGI
jgi:hypothetical protein